MSDFLDKAKKFNNNYKKRFFYKQDKKFDVVIPSYHSQHLDYVIDQLDCIKMLNKIIIVNDFDHEFAINMVKKENMI